MPVCLSVSISTAPTGQISIKFDTGDFNEKSVKKFQGDIKMLKVLFAANSVANFMLLNCQIFQLPDTSSIYCSA
jgi:hypothetical protein